MRYYYTDAQNKPTGPVELEQLRQLQAQGAISLQSYVIPEGGTQWISYASLLSAQAPAAATKPDSSTGTAMPQTAPTPAPAAAAPAESSAAKKAEAPSPAQQPGSGKIDDKAQPPPPATAPGKPEPTTTMAPAPIPESVPGGKPIPAPSVAAIEPPPAAKPPPSPAPSAPPQAATTTTAPNPFAQLSARLAQFIDLVLKTARTILTESLLRSILGRFTRGGYVLVLAGAVLGLVQAIVAGIRIGTFHGFASSFGGGLVALVAVAMLQYVAFRFFAANETLVKNNPSRVGSAALLDCLALVLLVGTFAALVGSTFTCIATMSLVPMIPGVIAAALLLFAAGIALNPTICNIETKESSAGEEAIGLASFFGKASLVAQPILFGVLALCGLIAICAALFHSQAADSMVGTLREIPAAGMLAGAGGSAFLLLACLIPAICHLGFLVLYLHLDLLRAILGLPRQLREFQR